MRILLVDDDPTSLLFLTIVIRSQGHEVITAHDGLEAYRLLQEGQASLVISDWNMPQLTGIELCRRIRSNALPHYVYFILLTVRNDRESLLEGMEAGADDFLSKPVDPGELRVRIRAGERVLRLEDELERRNAALNRVNTELSRAYDTIRQDVVMAAMIQKSLLPKPLHWEGARLEWLFLPNNLLAGDMLGYFPIGEQQLAFFLIDVSGHGVSSALICFSVTKLLWQQSHNDEANGFMRHPGETEDIPSPAQVLAGLNQRFSSGPESENYFLTMVYGVVDNRTGTVQLSAAGHPPPLLWRKQSGELLESTARGLPVGVLKNYDYQAETLSMSPGDRLFLFSDGIIECPSPAGELFGTERFRDLLQAVAAWPVAQVPDKISEALREWRGDDSYPDDISLLILEK